ncbi:MAG: hypothetical protein ABI867_39910 [Kofleriaceae bacterium]
MTAMTIEQLSTQLVQQAPALDPGTLEALITALREIGSPLALSIARVTELVAEQLIDPGIALPALAMACATLASPSFGAREHDAARYEIETLMPMPDRPPGTTITMPDVPVGNLIRGPRSRT